MSESRTVEQEFWSAWGVGHVKDSQRDTRDRNASTSQVLLKRVDADSKYLSSKSACLWLDPRDLQPKNGYRCTEGTRQRVFFH